MQWITPLSEDYGVQRLKADNRKPAIARAVAPTRMVGECLEAPHKRIESRYQGERRKHGDRRRKQVPVILDTRSSQNRRNPQGADERAALSCPRINVYA